MKNLVALLSIAGFIFISSCKKNSQSESFKLLTGPVWVSDSLLANGVDAAVPGGILENFKGDAKFNQDGTGYFGKYKGSWRFSSAETEIIITADSLVIPITTEIAELTSTSLKVTTIYPNLINLSAPIFIRMTFKAR